MGGPIQMLAPMYSLWRQLAQRGRREVQKHFDRRTARRYQPQWFLLLGRAAAGDWWSELNPARLTALLPPPDRFWADPFLWRQGERRYVFFEDYPFAVGRGRIGVLELDADLRPRGPARPVLEEDRHLSYPFLFEYRDALYMVPETARTRRIDLYRCVRFPDRWEYRHSLIEGLEAADATLFEHEGRWWLFCAARAGAVRINESLYAFHAETPLSRTWTAHPLNPLVRDFSRGRPGGRVIRDGEGRLIRSGQNSVPRYGHGLGLYRIETLSPRAYREQRLWRSSGAAGGWWGLHHLDWCQGELAMDAQRLLPRA